MCSRIRGTHLLTSGGDTLTVVLCFLFSKLAGILPEPMGKNPGSIEHQARALADFARLDVRFASTEPGGCCLLYVAWRISLVELKVPAGRRLS